MSEKLFMHEGVVWRRWFAWRPIKINRWHWLCWVARDQYANKPARYRYGAIRRGQ